MDNLKKRKIIFRFFSLLILACICNAATLQYCAASTNDAILGEARRYIQEKEYAKAIEVYEKISSAVHSDPSLLMELARAHTYADHHADAIVLFEELRSKFPRKEQEILRELADQYKWSRLYPKAIAAYIAYLNDNPFELKVRISLAETLLWDKRYDDALTQYNLILEKDPANSGIIESRNNLILRQARSLADEKSYGQALALYEKMADWLRKDPGLLIEWARVNTYADRHAEAIELFEEARQSYPQKENEILKELADQYKWNNQPAKAIELYSAHLNINPGDQKARASLAEALVGEKRFDEAMAQYNIMLAADPNNSTIIEIMNKLLLPQARSLVEGKSYDQALAIYEKMADWLRKDPGLLIEWARVNTYADKHAQAITLFEELRQNYPQKENEIIRELAEQYKWNNQPAKAADAYTAYLVIQPEDQDARVALAEALALEQKYDQALSEYALILEKNPDNAKAIDSRNAFILRQAQGLVKEKSYDAALELYGKLADGLRKDSGLLIEWARVNTYADKHTEAIALFEEVRTKYPEKENAVLRELGDQYKWNDQLSSAIDCYKAYLNNKPEDGQARLALAEALSWDKQPQEALAEYELVIQAQPDNTQAVDSRNNLVLNDARSLVQEKSFTQALELYAKLGDWLRKEFGHIVEWARVYAYADEHAQAIALFEEARNKYPEKEDEIIRELADQYKWSGQIKKATECYQKVLERQPKSVEAGLGMAKILSWNKQWPQAAMQYDAILQNNPGNIEALLGKAELLSWDDKIEQAYSLYEEVLKIAPDNIDALNGRARMRVWQGYHRKGIALYEEVLAAHPDNQDALQGLAFAYRWNKDNQKAMDTLERLQALALAGEQTKELEQEIRRDTRVRFSQSSRYSYDSNHLAVSVNSLRGVKSIDPATAIGASYDHYLFRQDGNSPVKANREGVDISKRFNEYWEANSYLYLTHYGFKGFTPFTTNTWLTFRPDDIWRFDLSYDRETFEDINAIRNGVIVNSGGFSFDFKPDRFWLLSAKYKRGSYSDGNSQNTPFGKAEYRFLRNPYVKLYYNYYYSDWGKQLNSGYFNPESIDSNTLGLYASKDLTKKLFVEGQGAWGYEKQKPKSNHPTFFGTLGLSYRLGLDWILSLRGEYFNAHDSNPKKSYSKKAFWLTLTCSFGREGEPAQPHEATQPQRPAGK